VKYENSCLLILVPRELCFQVLLSSREIQTCLSVKAENPEELLKKGVLKQVFVSAASSD